MCGIAGVWSVEPLADPISLAACLDRALVHRGPDSHAWSLLDAGRLLLLHRRLAIIDPSPSGAQPMTTADARHTIVFNGEIYNHNELRRSLEAEGERCVTRSDTEVLLRLVATRGPEALADVRGMFAFALWDSADRSLLVARDRFGIKPCYLAVTPRRLGIASEVQTLTVAGFGDGVDPVAVLEYFKWGTVPPPRTWRSGIEALLPGSWKMFSENGVRTGQFADVRRAWIGVPQQPVDDRSFTRDVLEAVDSSVSAHMVADVPVGVFLSAGVDSVVLASRARKYASGSLRTFTVSVDDAHLDEGADATRIAERLGVDHQVVHIGADDALRCVTDAVRRLDQPTLDGVNTFFISSAVAMQGIRAVLSGTGGDELFGGYPSFRRIPRLHRFSGAARPFGAAFVRGTAVLAPRARAAKLRYLAGSPLDVPSLYQTMRELLMPQEIDRLAGAQLCDRRETWSLAAEMDAQRMSPAGEESIAASVARLETTGYLTQQLLRDTDAASMAHGLEVRVPFVDAELLKAVWPQLGRRPHLLHRKHVLRSAIADPEIIDILAKPKRTFTLPFASWVRGPLRDFTRDGLASLEEERWLIADGAEQVWSEFEAGHAHWSRAWALSVLGQYVA